MKRQPKIKISTSGPQALAQLPSALKLALKNPLHGQALSILEDERLKNQVGIKCRTFPHWIKGENEQDEVLSPAGNIKNDN